MPSASQPPAAAAAASAPPASLGENKGIKFNIKSGNARWQCTLQDRNHYERTKASRTNSSDSATSSSSGASL